MRSTVRGPEITLEKTQNNPEHHREVTGVPLQGWRSSLPWQVLQEGRRPRKKMLQMGKVPCEEDLLSHQSNLRIRSVSLGEQGFPAMGGSQADEKQLPLKSWERDSSTSCSTGPSDFWL